MFAPFIAPIITFLTAAFAYLVKHPFVLKMMIFGIFTGIIAFAFNFIFNMVRPYISDNGLLIMAVQLGVIQGLALYITIIIAGFGAKQVLAFVRSS